MGETAKREWEEEEEEGGRGWGRQTCQETAVWQNDRFRGFVCRAGGGEDAGLAVGLHENWSNQALMCSGLQTLH